MIDPDKSQFKAMMQAITQLYGKQDLSVELLRIWWLKLHRYDFGMVSKAFNSWIDTNKKMPTPADILELCKSQESRQIVPAITKKITPEQKEHNRERLRQALSQLNMKTLH
ncbi:hypothetical protein UFOVP263_21 [uncultured Caudovirales phage]|uniref:Replicative helicase inhibitor G39P N-terminal domain-containing protein n=1 Tax=uncultured Caudovirales phage TaxID=2100421 RepID=A0A6J5TCN1_9CAUD|nr:hypothetical protein UFOVP263_21 [uncultured Caudovirales phage]CAB4242098.1 hypothetical protein UFOVP91_42 [uncultured Caudovirales phage]